MVDLTKQGLQNLFFDTLWIKSWETLYYVCQSYFLLLQLSIIKKKLSIFRMPLFLFFIIHIIICIPVMQKCRIQNSKYTNPIINYKEWNFC